MELIPITQFDIGFIIGYLVSILTIWFWNNNNNNKI